VARSYVNWTIGKLEFHLGYQHDDQQLPHQSRVGDFGFLRARRNF